MQETIRDYKLRMDKIKDYEIVIEELEQKLVRFKEEK
jgi:hypothetical protein